jgi:hypothetical protein
MKFIVFFAFSIMFLSCQETAKEANLQTTEQKVSPVAPTITGENNPTSGVAIDSSKFTTVAWESVEKDYGKIKEGEKLEAKFVFKNTGAYPLVIQSARASCGCTVAEYTKEPVAPGASGVVTGIFDSKDKPGHQKKSIYVYANTKGGQNHELSFGVEVLKK